MTNRTEDQLPPPDADQPVGRAQIADLISRIRQSADRLEADRTSRGDLKILSRALRELRYAFKVFAPYRGRRKVAVFGSARTPTDAPAYKQASEFGRALAQQKWLVVTGAAAGIMEAGHVGAGRDHSMGLNIMLPFEQDANPVIRGDHKLVNMKYFFTRKLMFVKECDAVVCLPGGFGTLDEAIEVITLLQTGKRELVPVVLLDEPGGNYWSSWLEFVKQHLLAGNMISSQDLSLFRVTDQVDEAVEDVLRFYRVFHSMRYVGERLVLRVQKPVPSEKLTRWSNEFSDILSGGQIESAGPLPGEEDEPAIQHLTRLVLPFDRYGHGRLRQLLDAINSDA